MDETAFCEVKCTQKVWRLIEMQSRIEIAIVRWHRSSVDRAANLAEMAPVESRFNTDLNHFNGGRQLIESINKTSINYNNGNASVANDGLPFVKLSQTAAVLQFNGSQCKKVRQSGFNCEVKVSKFSVGHLWALKVFPTWFSMLRNDAELLF